MKLARKVKTSRVSVVQEGVEFGVGGGVGSVDLQRTHGSLSFFNVLHAKCDELIRSKERKGFVGNAGTLDPRHLSDFCEDPKCHVWQHMSCVIIPEKPMDGAQPERPPRFYCEICRVSRADPALAKAVTLKLVGIWCHACFSRAWYIYFLRVIGDP
ncbi:hypothetical protein Syun_001139 [Stephania yunnanensis]|uniref:Zinc finger PHD-type domain-containing protein n=1 Tax=Stephania yunnanensis TaxID=152371 RepID=A0AAP0Q7G2_9MAGN